GSVTRLSMVERSLGRRAWRSVAARLRRLRALPLLRPVALRERWQERAGGHPVAAERRPHLVSAVEWLLRAQNAAVTGGFARGYSLTWHPYFKTRGWQPPYPETTGYIIPTLYLAAEVLGRPELASRAERAARWEIEVQLPSGAVRGGVIGEPESPAVFNTGQVMLGWLSAFAETEDGRFADVTRRAGRWLVATLDPDGHWRRGNSPFAHPHATLYTARAAWALAEAGRGPDAAWASRSSRRPRRATSSRWRSGSTPTAGFPTVAWPIRTGRCCTPSRTRFGACSRGAGSSRMITS